MYTNEPESVRDRLLDGALRCLQTKGYAETTARDIAAASGANLRSIGYHFGSTKELLLAAISLNFRRWLEPLIDATTDDRGSPAERIQLGMARFTEALPEHAAVLRAWLEAIVVAGHEADLRAVLASNQAEFRAGLEATLADAGLNQPQMQAAAVISVCDGVIVRFLLHGEVADPDEVARGAARAFEALRPEIGANDAKQEDPKGA